MYFSSSMFHPPVVVSPEHQSQAASAIASLAAQPSQPAAEPAPAWVELPITTVSLALNFDAYIQIQFKGASDADSMVIDTGNSMLIVPDWEILRDLPNYATDYEELGTGTEPWGCPAKVIRGPILIATASGDTYTIENCVFYACTGDPPPSGDPPTVGSRTANFGVGCLNPWPPSTANGPDGTAIPIQSPLSYDAAHPYLEFNFAPAGEVHAANGSLSVAAGSYLRLYSEPPSGYRMFTIIPDKEWMALTPKSLGIGGTQTQWPGDTPSPIAMIDTGGGPVYLSDPNGYLYSATWPEPVGNPDWAKGSDLCQSTRESIGIEIGDESGSYSYTVNTALLPATVQGLTLVMCKLNEYMRGQNGMNIGGISALTNDILIDYGKSMVGFRPQ